MLGSHCCWWHLQPIRKKPRCSWWWRAHGRRLGQRRSWCHGEVHCSHRGQIIFETGWLESCLFIYNLFFMSSKLCMIFLFYLAVMLIRISSIHFYLSSLLGSGSVGEAHRAALSHRALSDSQGRWGRSRSRQPWALTRKWKLRSAHCGRSYRNLSELIILKIYFAALVIAPLDLISQLSKSP